MTKTRMLTVVAVAASLLAAGGAVPAQAQQGAETPPELVMAYDQLAVTILAAKKTEWHVVQSILATSYNHAQGIYSAVQRKLEAGEDVSGDLETLADLVSHLGNEGDAEVAAIRKRLVEGGHHHNAQGEKQGIYDEGFVIVTRKAKKVFLDAAGNIARMASSPEATKLRREWQAVEKQYQNLW